MTVWDLTESNVAALVASAYLLFDVGMLTLNQYILLDPILLFFMSASVMAMVKVARATREQRAFTWHWWLWLTGSGTMIACTISVKFVGLFVVILVGLQTAYDLWMVLGDLTKPMVRMTPITKLIFCLPFIVAQHMFLCSKGHHWKGIYLKRPLLKKVHIKSVL